MDLSTLKAAPGARKKRKRVGRGPSSGHGKTSTYGHKGQKARSGGSLRPRFEGGQTPLYRRMPKRGFNHENRFASSVVNVDTLDKSFDNGAEVTTESLCAKGLADPANGIVKILGRGEITKKLKIVTSRISSTARAKVEAAGGSVEIVPLPGIKRAPATKTAKES